MQERLQQMRQEAEQLHDALRYSGSTLVRQRVRSLREGLDKCLKDTAALLAGHAIERPLARGDEVYVTKVHKWGEVERVDARRGRATVRVGSVQMDLPIEELQPWGETSG
jgi:dsDNA-specific endonuclease/ATPase MutS2